MKVTIQDLPLDAWVVVLLNIDRNNLLHVFNHLIQSRAINIALSQKLNTFWIVMSQARLYTYIEPIDDNFPHVNDYKTSHRVLCDMGFTNDVAYEAVRYSNGNIEGALSFLGIPMG
jgi:hypothetical protein